MLADQRSGRTGSSAQHQSLREKRVDVLQIADVEDMDAVRLSAPLYRGQQRHQLERVS